MTVKVNSKWSGQDRPSLGVARNARRPRTLTGHSRAICHRATSTTCLASPSLPGDAQPHPGTPQVPQGVT